MSLNKSRSLIHLSDNSEVHFKISSDASWTKLYFTWYYDSIARFLIIPLTFESINLIHVSSCQQSHISL